MLEDESGRLRLTGSLLNTTMLVTGIIVAVMGTENSDGDFEVIDIKIPELPRQPERWERDDADAALANGRSKTSKTTKPERSKGGKIALISGLGIDGEDSSELSLSLLSDYLLGEAGGQNSQEFASKITRLIIAGNSLSLPALHSAADEPASKKAAKKYGYDASAYNPAPTAHLDAFLATLLPSLPVTMIPGEADPANVSLPQQPVHAAILPHARAYSAAPPSDQTEKREPGWFDSVTNPWEADVDGWRLLGNGGQPLDDIFKYVEGEDRIGMMEAMLRWRLCAPTAPDTLCKLFLPYSKAFNVSHANDLRTMTHLHSLLSKQYPPKSSKSIESLL